MKKNLISVIIPNRKGEKNKTSLKNQTYKNFEVIEIIDEKLKGASWARNKGLRKANGEFIFFCDNDLDLEPDCLENLYDTLQKNPDKDWAFGRFLIDGEHFNCNKKKVPENKYSRDFVNYFWGVSTMSLIRAKAKPRFDENLKRFNDWDLWIRLAKSGHLPAFCDCLLFKTKIRKNGISGHDNNEKEKAKQRIYAKHLNKIADIVIPHHNRHDLLKNCLEKIDNSTFNIIIVSGGTFAENCNRGARIAQTENIIFLNDDTEPTMEALISLVEDENDITGIAQYIPSVRTIKYGIGFCDQTFNRKLCSDINDVLIPSGFCFKIKKKTWQKLNGFDEVFKNGAEDIDLFFRAKEKRCKIGYIINKKIEHLLSKSEGRYNHTDENEVILKDRWFDKVVKKTNKNMKENFFTVINEFVLGNTRYKKGDYVKCSGDLYENLKSKKCI